MKSDIGVSPTLDDRLPYEIKMIVNILTTFDTDVGHIQAKISEVNALFSRINTSVLGVLDGKSHIEQMILIYKAQSSFEVFKDELNVLEAELSNVVQKAERVYESFDSCLNQVHAYLSGFPDDELSKVFVVNDLKREILLQHINTAKTQITKFQMLDVATMPGLQSYLKIQDSLGLGGLSTVDILNLIHRGLSKLDQIRKFILVVLFTIVAICSYLKFADEYVIKFNTELLKSPLGMDILGVFVALTNIVLLACLLLVLWRLSGAISGTDESDYLGSVGLIVLIIILLFGLGVGLTYLKEMLLNHGVVNIYLVLPYSETLFLALNVIGLVLCLMFFLNNNKIKKIQRLKLSVVNEKRP